MCQGEDVELTINYLERRERREIQMLVYALQRNEQEAGTSQKNRQKKKKIVVKATILYLKQERSRSLSIFQWMTVGSVSG